MLRTSNLTLNQVVDENNGQYPKYSWPGAYPLFYLVNDTDVICPDCANSEQGEDDIITSYSANWEDDSLYCEFCNQRVESAYGDTEEQG